MLLKNQNVSQEASVHDKLQQSFITSFFTTLQKVSGLSESYLLFGTQIMFILNDWGWAVGKEVARAKVSKDARVLVVT